MGTGMGVWGCGSRGGTALALLLLLAPAPRAQADSTGARVDSAAAPAAAPAPLLRVEPAEARPSPGGALRRSLVLPGWGQVYVGKPVRAAVVVALLAGLGTGTVLANGRYVRLRHAYLYVSREDADPGTPDADNEYARYLQTWLDAGALPATTVRSQRDGARSRRDLVVLGTALAYALQALDAYVGAHLAGFDVSEDLSLHVGSAPDGPAATLTLRF
jgi:hypothetical protein